LPTIWSCLFAIVAIKKLRHDSLGIFIYWCAF
jgi:hypothetical protein